MRIYSYIYMCALLLLGASCANVVAPGGGEKDITPPAPQSFIPDTNSVNFEAREIRIQFDEYLQLNDVFNQVLVSPPLNTPPDIRMKGKTLIVSISDTLKENTTYTINFGQAIKDLTEGNTLDNFTYVFSTGPVLDSLQVTGTVKDRVTDKPVQKAYVVLYLEPSDTSFATTRPYYFARTDETGGFTIKNVRAGNYGLYALEDMNFNYFYDLPNERIAFQDSLLQLDSAVSKQTLFLFGENKIPLQLQDIRSIRYGMTRMAFTGNAAGSTVTYTGKDTAANYITRNAAGDTLIFWHSNYALDTHYLQLAFDTTMIERKIAVKTLHKDSVFNEQKNTFTHNAIAINKGTDTRAEWDPERPVLLKFYNPVLSVTDTPYIYSDSVLIGRATFTMDTFDARNASLFFPWKTEKQYDIVIPGNGIRDIFGLPTNTDTIRLSIRKADAYSDLSIALTNNTGHALIIELLKFDLSHVKHWNIPAEPTNNVIEQKYLTPGVYRIRAIVDKDNNGEWTTGDLELHRQPETIYYFPTDQNLRANWENEIEWVIE